MREEEWIARGWLGLLFVVFMVLVWFAVKPLWSTPEEIKLEPLRLKGPWLTSDFASVFPRPDYYLVKIIIRVKPEDRLDGSYRFKMDIGGIPGEGGEADYEIQACDEKVGCSQVVRFKSIGGRPKPPKGGGQ